MSVFFMLLAIILSFFLNIYLYFMYIRKPNSIEYEYYKKSFEKIYVKYNRMERHSMEAFFTISKLREVLQERKKKTLDTKMMKSFEKIYDELAEASIDFDI